MTTINNLEIYSASQSLHAVLIDATHDPKLRARIKRNAYDNQSTAVVEAWTTDGGWKVIHSVPITALDIAAYDYVYANWDRDHYRRTVNGKAGMPFWTDVIEADVRALMDYGYSFYGGAA